MLIKILKENDDYCIVRQYKTEELKELGFTNEEIYNMKNITLYDELVINPTEAQMLQQYYKLFKLQLQNKKTIDKKIKKIDTITSYYNEG